jgi:hypothetical protein
MMPSLLIVYVQSLERAEAADKAAKLERCKLGGATDMSAKHRALPGTQQKLEDAGLDPDTASKWKLGGKIGGPIDMSAKHRALLATQQKLKDAGLKPDSASKQALGGKIFGGKKGKCGGNQPGCGEGSHSGKKTETGTTQLNYLAYCASPAGKAYFANRCTHTAPDHYLDLLELNPRLQFMNASGSNKARIAPKKKQSKT